jgi:maltooligosyltrehalose trehalohydrolase
MAAVRRAHAMPFGAEVREGGETRFRLWAPAAGRVELLLGEAATPMAQAGDGWFESITSAGAGSRYAFRIDGGLTVADPASRANPDDVHAPSLVVDPRAFEWQDGDWRGRPWHEAIVYELHVGAFTREGTFAAAIERLDALAELGITAIELMPVAEFPGTRNWGYDGVLLFAPDASYGTPEDLKRQVQAAHARGLAVLLDVVYNHFGPEGNYLHAYAPQFFNAAHTTPWGAAINFDGERSRTVREFYVHNALYWIEEFHFDGLRVDAVHAIRDDSRPDIVDEIAQALREGPGRGRHVHLVLENDRNEARRLERAESGAPLLATAQWNDDLHHALHVLATGERDGYYADYADSPLAQLGRALAEGFVYQGQTSPFRHGRPRGEPSAHLPPEAFVASLQNHDQVGNRALGERLASFAEPSLEHAALACLLLGPQIPMLFMGEEYSAATPFLYFCDFGGELAEAVRNGRREEFARFAAFAHPAARERIPDPGAPSTFEASKLRWDERARSPHRERLALARELIALRREHIVPRLAGARTRGHPEIVNGVLQVAWRMGDGAVLTLRLHFAGPPATIPAPPGGRTLYQSAVRDAPDGEHTFHPGGIHVGLRLPGV